MDRLRNSLEFAASYNIAKWRFLGRAAIQYGGAHRHFLGGCWVKMRVVVDYLLHR
jgi:hypothetical protein